MKALLAVPLLALAACSATQQQAWNTYSGHEEVAFASQGREWLVTDRPDLGSLIISPSAADGAMQGAAFGATFGIAGRPDHSAYIPAVAQEFVASRGCKITGTSVVVASAYYEAHYTC